MRKSFFFVFFFFCSSVWKTFTGAAAAAEVAPATVAGKGDDMKNESEGHGCETECVRQECDHCVMRGDCGMAVLNPLFS